MSELENLKKELDHYRKKFSLGEHDIAIKGYAAYVKILNQQIDHIEKFSIAANIDGKKADTVMYDRSVAMWESLPDMITKMNRLKAELKLDFDIDADKPKVGATNPQTIANLKTV